MQVSSVAFPTVVSLGAATAASAIAVAVVASTVATVAYGVLVTVLAGASIASITAWMDPSSTDCSSYFKNVAAHAKIAIAGTVQLVAQTLFLSIINGIGMGISRKIERKFS